jgi:hypothetical protein
VRSRIRPAFIHDRQQRIGRLGLEPGKQSILGHGFEFGSHGNLSHLRPASYPKPVRRFKAAKQRRPTRNLTNPPIML